MALRIIVVGGGIIGASAAYQLQKSGGSVLVLDGGGARATDASFGWINASFFQNVDYFHLRSAGMAAYRTLLQELALPVRWSGCLSWEAAGAELDAQRDALIDVGYDVEEIDGATFAQREPYVADPPDRCLSFPREGVADSASLAEQLLQAAVDLGAQVVRGAAVTGFLTRGDQVTGVQSTGGNLAADRVLVAAGTATEALLARIDVRLPMLTRPAVVIRTQPVVPLVRHVLASPIGEIRQVPSGALLMPAAISHQGDSAEALGDAVPDVADEALRRLQTMFPSVDLSWTEATLAFRPVPEDGMPVVGQVRDGLYVASMHSGITLAALMGQQIATELLEGPSNETARLLAPYRPARFERQTKKGATHCAAP